MLCLIFGSLIFFFYTFKRDRADLCIGCSVYMCCKVQSELYVCGCVWLDLVVVPRKPEEL